MNALTAFLARYGTRGYPLMVEALLDQAEDSPLKDELLDATNQLKLAIAEAEPAILEMMKR